MNPSLASLICAAGIAVLFYLDRDNSVRTSKALWLPVFYLWIAGSRSVSAWLGVAPANGSNVQLDGSPLDALVYGLLLAAAVVILMWRRKRTRTFLVANWPILIFFFYCLFSVAWAPFPDVAFKRWIKSIGDIVMVLVIATETEPTVAFRRIISRVGFLLLPASVLLIKYFNDLGRAYDPSGGQMNTGVTTNKNLLGVVVLVVSIGALWNVRWLLTHKNAPNRGRRLLAQGILFAFGLVLLGMAHCATAVACFFLGGGLILATNLRVIRIRPARVHILCLAIILAGGVTLLSGGEGDVAQTLGRDSNLTGRTEIWAAVVSAVSNPIIGDGYESFWISPDEQKVSHSLKAKGWWHPESLNEAHNGYIETYLNLGWIGVCLVSLVLITGYRRAAQALQRDPELGALSLAFVVIFAFYNISEAGFRMTGVPWIFLLLAVVSSTGVAFGLCDIEASKVLASRDGTASRTPVGNKLIAERETAYTAHRS